MISIDAFRPDGPAPRHLAEVLDAVADAFLAVDDEWRVVHLNTAAERVLGVSRADLVGRSVWDACPRAVGSTADHEAHRASVERQTIHFEQYVEALGRWFTVRVEPVEGGLAVYAHDRTASKRHRDALRQTEEAIRNGQARLRLALSAAKMVAFESDLSRGWTVCSEGAEALFGFREGPAEAFEKLIHPEDLPHVLAAWERAIREGTNYDIEYRVNHPDAGVRWYATRGHVVTGADGRAQEMFGVTVDVTERRREEAELRQAKDAAEAANRAKDQFLAVLSHELRTPLTPVLMATASLDAEPGLPETVRQDVAMIRRNVELETRLIDDLLDLSRIVNGKLAMRLAEVELHPLLRGVADIVGPELLSKGLTLTWELGAARDRVRADAARVQQVLWNLLKNAVKFTPRGGRITVSTANPSPARLRVEVADTGVGIEPGVLPRIFNAFDQGENGSAPRFGGLGLGLAISKAIADMHGGTLAARSAGREQGATFVLELDTALAPSPVDQNIDAPVGGGAALKPVHVLLVEDHADTRHTLRRLLEGAGFAVEAVSTVHDAVAAATANGFDVLVSDIGLPDGTGHDLIRELRVRSGEVAGIAISGLGMDDDVRRSKDAGFGEHLVKPVNVRDLLAAIGAAVARRAGRGTPLAGGLPD